jgi:hypothetical protein
MQSERWVIVIHHNKKLLCASTPAYAFFCLLLFIEADLNTLSQTPTIVFIVKICLLYILNGLFFCSRSLFSGGIEKNENFLY